MINIHVEALLPGLNKLTSPATAAIIRNQAVLVGASTLRDYIAQSLLSSVPKANTPNPKYTDTLLDAIRFSKIREQDRSRIVHAYGVRTKGSGTYRTRFFDKTTKPRYQKTRNGKKLKKKKYVGVIGGTFFFEKGYQAGKGPAQERMKQAIENYITKIANG